MTKTLEVIEICPIIQQHKNISITTKKGMHFELMWRGLNHQLAAVRTWVICFYKTLKTDVG